MRSPLFWRRFVAAGGVYVSALLGFAGSIVAVRELGIYSFGLLALVLAATGFFQLLADLTVEEALVKYGFRYAAREDWGRFHRVFRIGLWLKLAGGLLGAAGIAVLAPLSGLIWTHGLFGPMLIAALIPLAQAPEGVGSAALIVRGRYDLRALFLVVSMALRLAALAIGGAFGVTETVVALVVAQALSTTAILGAAVVVLRRFPQQEPEPLGEDRMAFRRFVIQSSLGSVLSPLRGFLGTLLLGVVTGPRQVAYFRVGDVPESAFASLTAPARLILLTEQTADVERGRDDLAYRMLRRYSLGAGAFMLVVLPPLAVFMPTLIRFAYGQQAAPATAAARLFLAVAAIQVVWGWSKSFPVSIGRPELRLLAQGAEIVVLIPTLLVLGSAYGATGGAGAFVISACVFAAVWTGIVYRLRRERRAARAAVAPR
jgi:O-antigen/teichoic acid export membrane protein